MRVIVAILASLIMWSPAAAETFGEKRAYFKDWLAACRPATNYCSAITYINPNPGDGAVADYWLRVGRQIDGEQWEISMVTIVDMPNSSSSIFFKTDTGEEHWFSRGNDIVAYGGVNEFYLLGHSAELLFSEMIAGRRLDAGFWNDADQSLDFTFSLSGLSASLLWIDENQKRLGSPRIAGALPINQTLAEDRITLPGMLSDPLMELHAKTASCEPLYELIHAEDWGVYQVNNESLLYMIPCTAGAYNFGYSFYTYNTKYDQYQALLFADYWDSVGWTGTDVLINAYYDPETRTLGSFYKGRGIGDCGTSGEWRWEQYGFKLIKFNAKSKCEGYSDDQAIGEFPQIYPPVTN